MTDSVVYGAGTPHLRYNHITDRVEADRPLRTTLDSLFLGEQFRVTAAGATISWVDEHLKTGFNPVITSFGDHSLPGGVGEFVVNQPTAITYGPFLNVMVAGPVGDGTLVVDYDFTILLPTTNSNWGHTWVAGEDYAGPLTYRVTYASDGVVVQDRQYDVDVVVGDTFKKLFSSPIDLIAGETMTFELLKSDGLPMRIFANAVGDRPWVIIHQRSISFEPITLTKDLQTLTSPDGSKIFTLTDAPRLSYSDGVRDRIVVDDTVTDLLSPDGSFKFSASDTRLTLRDGTRDRIFVDNNFSILFSPDGLQNISVGNTGAFYKGSELATLADVNFLGLSDTPLDFIGQAGRNIEVNLAEDGVQFGQNLTALGNPQFLGLTVTQNATVLGDLVVGGDFTVNGTTTTINSTTLEVLDKNIEMGVVAIPTDLTADGGGITLRGDTDKTILWTNFTNSWDFNQKILAQMGLEVKGDLTNFGLNMDPDSLAAGTGALGATTTGSINTALGTDAGKAITGGFFNVAVGSGAMKALTSGFFNVAVGPFALFIATTQSDNTAIGTAALKFSTGSGNTAIGSNVMAQGLGSGGDNVAIGVETFKAVTSGSRNVAIGNLAMKLANVAKSNIAIGWSAMGGAASGDFNIAIGEEALRNSTVNDNVAIGFHALMANTTGILNTAIGTDALRLGITASRNTAVGHKALELSTGGFNTAVGTGAGSNQIGGSSNSFFGAGAGKSTVAGGFNVAIGADAMGLGIGSTLGNDNVAVGAEALSALTVGTKNVAVGRGALSVATDATSNVAVGHSALTSNISGDSNVAVGVDALRNAIVGRNVAIGFGAGLLVTTGNVNTLIGDAAGSLLTTGSNNIIIGAGAELDSGDFNNETMIGTPLTTDARIYGTHFQLHDGAVARINFGPFDTRILGPSGQVGIVIDDSRAVYKGSEIATLQDLSTNSTRIFSGDVIREGEFMLIGPLTAHINLTIDTSKITRFKVRDRGSNIGTFFVNLIIEAGVTELLLVVPRDYVEVALDPTDGNWYFYNFRNGVGGII